MKFCGKCLVHPRDMIMCIYYLLVLFVSLFSCLSVAHLTISTNEDASFLDNGSECRRDSGELGEYSSICISAKCGRRIIDGLFSDDDIKRLHNIGMSKRKNLGGPTILDINTGYIRDTAGLENLFSRNEEVYSNDDFSHYGRIIQGLKDKITSTFSIDDLYFTAPTFITRLDGRDSWSPEQIHDEYWHPHSDMNNTAHYHYSGLLYMSEYQKDFEGGRLVFLKDDTSEIDLIVEPKVGRTALFTSGPENTHYVEKVSSGQRFVLSFWFTCDPSRQFEIFLDGKEHTKFSHRIRDAHARQRKKEESEL